jgi:acetoin utilization deacetylase AcuC-like enzyme
MVRGGSAAGALVEERTVKPVGLVMDPCFEEHLTGPGHPEQPERLAAVRAALESSGLAAQCERVPVARADDDLLGLVHDPDHIERVEQACARGELLVDSMDTTICLESARVARQAAGSVVALCDGVARGCWASGLAAVRPPGHHAERDLAMGFCLFNNVAVAARHLLREGLASRVLIVDWDVHHGNGTQHQFEEDPAVFFFSVHQSPLYPGTGASGETGRGAGEGATLNRPLAPGSGDDEFLGALRDGLVPAAGCFRPDFVLVSAGFDAHRADPLGGLRVSTGAFVEATRIVLDLAERSAAGRIVSVLEGGYDLDALAESAAAHLRELLIDRGR